jgi:hypothetical protein
VTVQRVEDHQPADWPNESGPKQMHLELAVDELDRAETGALAIEPARPMNNHRRIGGGCCWTCRSSIPHHPNDTCSAGSGLTPPPSRIGARNRTLEAESTCRCIERRPSNRALHRPIENRGAPYGTASADSVVQIRTGSPRDPSDQVRVGDGVARRAVAVRLAAGDRDRAGDGRSAATAASARRGGGRRGGGRGGPGGAATAVGRRGGAQRGRGVHGGVSAGGSACGQAGRHVQTLKSPAYRGDFKAQRIVRPVRLLSRKITVRHRKRPQTKPPKGSRGRGGATCRAG